MKILHIINSLMMGGAENVLASLVAGQKILGHDVTVMPLVCAQSTPVREKIEACGVPVRPLKTKGSCYDLLLILRIAKVMRSYDVIHVHLFPSLYWTAFAKAISFSRIPLVYTEHSTNNRRRNNVILHFFDKLVYKYSYKQVIACAEKVLESYKTAFPGIHHVCYINNGVNTSLFMNALPYKKQELLGEDDCFMVTMVARFMFMKRQDTVIEAIKKLPEKIHAVFVGGNEDDEGLQRIKSKAERLGVSHRVHFLYTRKDVSRILKTSDVVIMASDYEGLSLSSVEGMAAGKPFIATNVNGLREVVGGAGLLFENKNAEELSKAILSLYKDEDLYKSIAEKCLQRSMQYDVDKMVTSYLNVYNSVLN